MRPFIEKNPIDLLNCYEYIKYAKRIEEVKPTDYYFLRSHIIWKEVQ